MEFDRSSVAAKYLNVTKGGKTVKMAVSAMDDALLKTALGRSDNANALASGWSRGSDGSVFKTPSAPAPALGTVAPGTPPPTSYAPKPSTAGVGTVAPGTKPPTNPNQGGFLQVYQKQPNGKYAVVWMAKSAMSPAQLREALASPLNRPGAPKPSTPAPGGGGGGGGAPAGGAPTQTPAADPAPAPAGPRIPSWIPNQIDLSGLLGGMSTNPLSGRIDWSALIKATQGVSQADPQYAADLSAAILAAQQAIGGHEAEAMSLTAVNPVTGKTLAQSLMEQAARTYQQGTSSAMGSAAARGLSSSGMQDTTLGQLTAANTNERGQIESTYGNARLEQLRQAIIASLQGQNMNFTNAFAGANARAYAGIPAIGG